MTKIIWYVFNLFFIEYAMNAFFKKRAARLRGLLLVLACFCLLFASGCKDEVAYYDYVSELRSNILVAKTEEYSLRVYAVSKESPYATDGVARERSSRLEAYLTAPSGADDYAISFTVLGNDYGGDMSYDNVKREYFYSCTLDIAEVKELDCTFSFGEKTLTLTACSVVDEDTISPRAALDIVCNERPELFQALTDEYGFAGEIYLRLLYEDSPYYYIGVIDREGKTQAFLLNAKTGKILAQREQ